MYKLLFLLLLPLGLFAEVDVTTSQTGQELISKRVYVPDGAEVLVTLTASVSHQQLYGRNWLTLRRNGKPISGKFGNREHEDGSGTGLSDVITITVIDKPRKAGTYRYNAFWAVNLGTGYVGAKNFSVSILKP